MPLHSAREVLLRRLDNRRLDDPTAFVLLWTYFESVGLTDAENRLVRTGRVPGPLGTYPARIDDTSYTTATGATWLRSFAKNPDFDLFALSWLAGLDRLLGTERGTFEHQEVAGIDDRTYKVRPVNNWIARHYEHVWSVPSGEQSSRRSRAVTTKRKQSLALALYCRNFIAVDLTPRAGLRLAILSRSRWADPFIHDRLAVARYSGLRIACWPIRYPLSVERLKLDTGEFVRVVAAPPAATRQQELSAAVGYARSVRATLLVLPELVIAPEDLTVLQDALASDGAAEYPILTVAGLVHERGSTADVNACLILGPDGRVLHRHEKLTRYGGGDADEIEWVEGIETGDVIHVLESPVGNLTPLICRDLFHEGVGAVVASSHANVLLVPSLSPKTTAHETAAFRFLSANAATTVVCNRGIAKPDSARNGTFVLLPGKTPDGKRTLLTRLVGDDDALVCGVE